MIAVNKDAANTARIIHPPQSPVFRSIARMFPQIKEIESLAIDVRFQLLLIAAAWLVLLFRADR